MTYTEILSTKPQFPELLLRVFGNSGVLSYKIKCLSIGLVLYSLGIFTTFTSNTLQDYIKDYAFLINTMAGSVTFYAIIYACKQINPAISQLDQTIEHSKEKRFIQYIKKINHNPVEVFSYYLLTLGFSIIFAILAFLGFMGPPWVKEVSQSARYTNLIYYTLWCAIIGYIVGAILNRLMYYSNFIHGYCKEFVVPDKINILSLGGVGGLESLGSLALKFNVACTIPTIGIVITNFKTIMEGGLLINRPIPAAIMIIYVIILVFIFFFPIRSTHYTLLKAKKRDLDYLDEIIKRTVQVKIPNRPEEFLMYNSIMLTRERIMKIPTWPLNLSLLIKFLGTIMLPLSLGAIIEIFF